MPRFRAKYGPWKVREYAVALGKTPQFVNAKVRAEKIDALITGSSVLISHPVVAAGLGMDLETAEVAWPDCAAEAERRAALEAAQDKRNQPRPRQVRSKPKHRETRATAEVHHHRPARNQSGGGGSGGVAR